MFTKYDKTTHIKLTVSITLFLNMVPLSKFVSCSTLAQIIFLSLPERDTMQVNVHHPFTHSQLLWQCSDQMDLLCCCFILFLCLQQGLMQPWLTSSSLGSLESGHIPLTFFPPAPGCRITGGCTIIPSSKFPNLKFFLQIFSSTIFFIHFFPQIYK